MKTELFCYLLKAAHFRRQHHICKLTSSKDSNTTEKVTF